MARKVWLSLFFLLLEGHLSSSDDSIVYTPITRFYNFEVGYIEVTRLCRTRAVVVMNGQYPGPTIYVREGDRILVNVTNRAMGAPLTIHWHGVRQIGSPWADGTSFITQCPIGYGNSYVYDFHVVNQRGTLYWHAHLTWLRATVYGAFIILPAHQAYPFSRPDAEATILLGEWWSRDFSDIEAGLDATGGSAPIVDANTINGLPGPLDKCGGTEQQSNDMYTLEVYPGKTYLLRLINAALHASFYFAIANHTLTIVEADAAYTKPVTSQTVFLAPGQTLNVLLRADNPPGWYRILSYPTTTLRVLNAIPAAGLLFYNVASGQNGPPSLPEPLPLDSPRLQLAVDSLSRSLAPGDVQLPLVIDRYFFLAISLGVLNQSCPNSPTGQCMGLNAERTSASLNNVSFLLPNVSLLEMVYAGRPLATDFPDFPPTPYNYTQEEREPAGFGFFHPLQATEVSIIDRGDNVEMVLQGTSFPQPESHPMHLHGYSFYVVGSGLGNFDPVSDPRNFNLDDPPLRNTVSVPAGGWSVIRFKADNPGVWIFHCHVEAHQYWGMRTAFWVKSHQGANDDIPTPPDDLPQC